MNKTLATAIKFDPTSKFFGLLCSNRTVLIYDSANYELSNTFAGHTGIIYDFIFNSDPSMLTLYTASDDSTIKIWDIILNK